jgi:nitrite reductase/ring-hydroxylating ferredoxin subunit
MIFAAKISEIPSFGSKVITLGGKSLLLVNVKGNFFACDNECPHQGSPMAGGIVKEGYLTCPRHGFRFDLKTGACADAPAFALKFYPTELRGDELFVDIS